MIFPVLWRYLILQYGKIFALTLVGFLFILLTTRLEEAARLVSLGTSVDSVALYILYQIPYVLQVALPIASLIGAIYLFQRLSSNNELTAARASGISLFELYAPLLLVSLAISFLSFQMIFDLSVRSHLAAKQLEYSVREMNPLAILQNSRLLDARGIKVDMKGSLISDKRASDLILAMKAGENGHATIVLAKELASYEQTLSGKHTTVITTKDGKNDTGFDDLLIENTEENETALNGIAMVLNKRKMWKAGNDLLRLPLLLAKRKNLEQKVEVKEYKGKSPKSITRKIRKVDAEVVRRISLSLAIVTFTLLGCAYGSHIGRLHSKRRFVGVVLLVALFLVCYLAAKSLEQNPRTACLLFLLPHAVIITASIRRLLHIQQGVEA